MSELTWLAADAAIESFPPLEQALLEPDGLLAAGGDLSEQRLLHAYSRGIFPWYEEGQPILWWSPDPRTVLNIDELHLSRSLKRHIRRSVREYSFNQAFDDVIDACAAPRGDYAGTWITREMKQAYRALHRAGWAHSVEIWEDRALVGGLYGVGIDRFFFGESMFSRATDGSKMALTALAASMRRLGLPLLDCQIKSSHLLTLGAQTIPRHDFEVLLRRYCSGVTRISGFPAGWQKVLNLLD